MKRRFGVFSGTNSNPEVIQILLEAGADLEARDNNGLTPLMAAAGWNRDPEMVRTLLDAGADGKAKCHSNNTAYDYYLLNQILQETDIGLLLKKVLD